MNFTMYNIAVNKALRKLAGKDGSGDGDNGGLTTERINSITNRYNYIIVIKLQKYFFSDCQIFQLSICE